MADIWFGKYHLEKHGWTEGVGLGKQENGIIDPIKVVRKSNKDGIGFIPGSDLTKNWWDQAYNKAASKILVNTTKDGVTICATETKEISKKKSLLYARFVKGATLKATKGITVEEPEDPSESDTEKEQIPPRLTDEEIFKICGGRTAHKAAGHGLKQNGKLQRIWEQERQYLESLNKETDPLSNVPVSEPKRGKKCKRDAEEATEQIVLNEEMNSQEESHRKKRKKDPQEEEEEEAIQVEDTTELVEYTKKEKKKKKKSKERKQNKRKEKEDKDEQVGENGKFRPAKKKQKKKCELEEEDMEAADIETVSHSEKKKMKKRYLEEPEKESEEASNVEISEKKKQDKNEDFEVTEQEFGELTKKKKKHKVKKKQLEEAKSIEKRKRKTQHPVEEEIEYTEENTIKTLDPSEVEGKEERKKKHKKKKKKEHRKKQKAEKSFIEDEESSVNVQQQKVEEEFGDKMEEEMNENTFKQKSTKVDNSQKKVRFSLELVEIFTFSDEENDTSPQTP